MAAFDVYIVHSHILVFDNLITKNLTWIGNYNLAIQIVLVFACVIAIYAIGTVTYLIRTIIFKYLFIEKILMTVSKITDKIFIKGINEND